MHISANIIFKNHYMLIGIHIFVIFHRPFVIRNFRGTCSSIEMLKGYIEKVWEHLLYMLVNS